MLRALHVFVVCLLYIPAQSINLQHIQPNVHKRGQSQPLLLVEAGSNVSSQRRHEESHWRTTVELGHTSVHLEHSLYATRHKEKAGPFGWWLLGVFAAIVIANFALTELLQALNRNTSDGAAAPPESVGDRAVPETKAATPSDAQKSKFVAALWLISWMVCSAFFVLFNKWLFTKGGFPHPCYLTTFHMMSCYAVFSLIRLGPTRLQEQVMPDAYKVIAWKKYFVGLFPIALLYGYSLGAGNVAFMHSSVAFLQMIKPINVLFASLAAFAFMLETPTGTHVMVVCIVICGVAIAAAGDIEFSATGLICQLTGCFAEGLRLAMLQKVTTKDMKLDPVTTIYRFAPAAGIALAFVSCFLEDPVKWSEVKPGFVVLNCIAAVLLNILIVNVIKRASAVIFTLGGIVKDIATIVVSLVLFHTVITRMEIAGYIISIFGICCYKVYKDNLALFKEKGLAGGVSKVMSDNIAGIAGAKAKQTT